MMGRSITRHRRREGGKGILLALLLAFLILLTKALESFLLLLSPNGPEEGVEVGIEIFVSDSKVPIQQVQQLFFHQIHLVHRESKLFVSSHRRVACPMLVLRGRVVEILGGQDERGQKDAMNGAPHSLGYLGQPLSQAGQINQRGHQGRDLHV